MKTAGGIIAIVAGAFSIIAAIFTLFVGGVGGAMETEGAETVVGLGWAGLFLSFVVIVLGAAVIAAKGRLPIYLLLVCSLAAAIFGGTFVAVVMSLAILGGILALFDKKPVEGGTS